MKKQLFLTYWQHLARFQSHLQHTVSFLDKVIKKNDDFHKHWIFFFSFHWLFQCFCQVIIPKKILTQVSMAKKLPKMPKNANLGALFDPFLSLFLSFWWTSLCRELRGPGIAQTFDMFLFKIWKQITWISALESRNWLNWKNNVPFMH